MPIFFLHAIASCREVNCSGGSLGTSFKVVMRHLSVCFDICLSVRSIWYIGSCFINTLLFICMSFS